MSRVNISARLLLEGGLQLAIQLALIVGLCFGALWLWPDDLFGKPMSAITFPQVLRAVSTPGLLLAAAAWLYLLVEPLVKR